VRQERRVLKVQLAQLALQVLKEIQEIRDRQDRKVLLAQQVQRGLKAVKVKPAPRVQQVHKV
jgi:hypothetical protein